MERMLPTLVLLHSPLLGPRSWAPVATELAAADHQVAVPSLLGIARGEPPFWPRVVDAVGAHLRGSAPGRPVILVAHSNVGFFVPLLARGLESGATFYHSVSPPSEPDRAEEGKWIGEGRPAGVVVRGCLFVDAALPGRAAETPVVPEGAFPFLREKATDGVLPPWTEWWEDEEVRSLFPDEATHQAVAAEEPRLPLAYFEQSVPVPAHWDERPCAYVQFSPPYDEAAAYARERGWTVEHLPGGHLHMLAEPAGVARLLTAVADKAGMGSP